MAGGAGRVGAGVLLSVACVCGAFFVFQRCTPPETTAHDSSSDWWEQRQLVADLAHRTRTLEEALWTTQQERARLERALGRLQGGDSRDHDYRQEQAETTTSSSSSSSSKGGALRVYVYPMDSPRDINGEILQRNRGWVLSEWNAHNQYIPEYVIHQNMLRAAERVQDPAQATVFFLPAYARIGMYNTDLKEQLQRQVEATLRDSPWFRRRGGRDHVVVWSSQRRPVDLLGPAVAALLDRCIVLNVEPFDSRHGALRFKEATDIAIPAYVPASAEEEGVEESQHGEQQLFGGSVKDSRVNSGGASQRRLFETWRDKAPLPQGGAPPAAWHVPRPERDVFVLFEGTLANDGTRGVLVRAFENETDCVLRETQVKPTQENNTRSAAALAMKAMIQQSAALMRRAVFCLCPRGKTPGTRRLWEAVLHGCIPVVVSDGLQWLPFSSFVDLEAAVVRIPERLAHDAPRLLRAIPQGSIADKQTILNDVRHWFLYHLPASKPGDAFSGIVVELKNRLHAA